MPEVSLVSHIPAAIGALLLVAFMLGEGRLRKGPEARSRDAGPSDKGTTRVLGAVFAFSFVTYVVASFLAAFGAAKFPVRVAWAGVVGMIFGLALRMWAAVVLGSSYTRTLRIQDTQKLVQDGPYGVVRHPGYAGIVVMWISASLATGDWLAPIVIVPVMLSAYVLRISAEERMIEMAFGENFRDYARKTCRLVPFIY